MSECHRTAEVFDGLCAWLRDGGASCGKVGVRQMGEEGEYGVVCTQEIKRGERFLTVPVDLCITPDTVLEACPQLGPLVNLDRLLLGHQHTGEAATADDADTVDGTPPNGRRDCNGDDLASSGESPPALQLLSGHSAVAAFLLYERNKGHRSKWRNYIASLPPLSLVRRHHSVFFSDKDLTWLIGTTVHTRGEVKRRKQEIMTDYAILTIALGDFSSVASLEDFMWARCIVGSRLFSFLRQRQKDATCPLVMLCPLADILNHKMPPESRWYFDACEGCFVLEALRDFTVGEEVHDSYGPKANRLLYLYYGFTLLDQHHIHDTVDVHVDLSEEQRELWAAKARHFSGKAIDVDGNNTHRLTFRLAWDSADPSLYQRLMAFLRIHVITDVDELPSISDMWSVPPISVHNELLALTHFQQLCADALKRYPASLQDDEQLLQRPGSPLTPPQRNALVVRIGEQRLLRHYESMCVRAADVLNRPAVEVRRWLAKRTRENTTHWDYFGTVPHQLLEMTSQTDNK
ncbi:unnamed protein product [Vitrella brassicaformis CCMP3155]|uniref:SET domain-containing protein n=2 Tax=Vitrella brassicaformis TaxID=1169539 RepID=A0A0G4F4W2_VITBC|nr:unnamed protein product [Vitrella brassicaformis CCMP3155]|eukprot:CEM06975.1 unnamed protein product [Vitrella brassicaformis CCMP3155]